MSEFRSSPSRPKPPSRSRRRFLLRACQASTALLVGAASRGAASADYGGYGGYGNRGNSRDDREQAGKAPGDITGQDAAEAGTTRRIALLVCCGSYPDGKNIQPARKNGRDLEAALRRQRFDVEVEFDLDLPRFAAAIERFRQRLATLPGDGRTIALIYFVGHGMQVEGRNYLLPSGVGIDDPKAKERSINLQDQVLAAFPQRYPGLGIAVIDACRDSAEPDDKAGSFNYSTAPAGCVVAFSASAGQVSLSPSDPTKNSFYTGELVQVLNEVDTETPITDIFELTRLRVEKTMASHPAAIVRKLAQRPHMTSGQTGVFVLGRARSEAEVRSAAAEAYARQAAILLPQDVKREAEDFLRTYPKSRYDAQVRVAQSGAEDALRALSSRFVRLSSSAFSSAKGDERFMEDLRKALRGDKDAAGRVAVMYREGRNGQTANPQRGEQWLRYSALLGNAIACYELYRTLAERGDPDAEFFGPEAIRLGYQPPKALCGSRKSENC